MDRLTEAYNSHDVDAITRCYGPRAVTVTPGGVAEGREEIYSYYAEWVGAFPDSVATPSLLVVSEDTGVLEFMVTGTHKGPLVLADGVVAEATGRPIALRCCSVCTMEDGAVASHRLYYDQLELAAQLGYPMPGGDRAF
ncbi:ester cyclase [Sphaerisporangium perillae]|uniref:ester cyclase n=1 Tax=Sphaerisporangium perillae TaxID=2935860 RepID=UPI00200CFED1|nr:nuclear transport factor 2 family protein [Sphaerisporangium perillae]